MNTIFPQCCDMTDPWCEYCGGARGAEARLVAKDRGRQVGELLARASRARFCSFSWSDVFGNFCFRSACERELADLSAGSDRLREGLRKVFLDAARESFLSETRSEAHV